jgi:hypothetical protein
VENLSIRHLESFLTAQEKQNSASFLESRKAEAFRFHVGQTLYLKFLRLAVRLER